MELKILLWLQDFKSPFLDSLFTGFTLLGEETFYILVIAVIYWTLSKRLGSQLISILLLSTGINFTLKSLISRPRPIGLEGITSERLHTAGGKAMPSGHTQVSAAFFFGLSKLGQKKIYYLLALLITLATGLSRLYLGLHWPTDVLVAILLGLVISHLALRLYEHPKGFLVHWIFFCFFTLYGFYTKDSDLIMITGAYGGYLLSMTWLSAYYTFRVKASLQRQLVKILLGLSLILLTKEGLGFLFPELLIFDFIRYLFIGLVGFTLIPYLFRSKDQ